MNPFLKPPMVSVCKNVHIPYASCGRTMKIHPQFLNSFFLILQVILYFDDFKYIKYIQRKKIFYEILLASLIF